MDIAVLAFGFSLALIVAAIWLYFDTQLEREALGVPRGEIMYADGEDVFEPDPLYAHDIGLVGKPDYLVRIADGTIVPVEVKSAEAPTNPYDSHVMQLAAYCLLVEEVHGRRPPYGYIRYRDTTVRVPYTDELRTALLDTLTEMQLALYADTMPRSHRDPRRCARCGMAYVCGSEKLSS